MRYTWRTGVREGVMVLLALAFLSPVYILLNLALGDGATQVSPLIPTANPSLDNFVVAWEEGALGMALLTTTGVTVASVVLLVIVSSMAAYPLARITARWSKWVFYLIIFGLTLPFFIALVPLYQTMHVLGLLGSPLSLVILYTGHQFPLSVFLYTAFLRELPLDYEEAALLDGCSPFKAFVLVVFPLVRPVTGTVVILNIIGIWNDFLVPLLFLGTGRLKMLPVAIFGFVGEFTAQWTLIFAAVTISILPLLILYFVMQKRVMQGFSSGVKG